MLRNKVYYLHEYVQKERSPADIAKEHNTYPNKIRREIKACGIVLRDKSKAQSVAIKQGRHKHPTKGRERPLDVRYKISASMAKAWDDMDDEERQRRIELSRQQWLATPPTKKAEFKQLAAQAVRQAAETGSKLERFILEALTACAYDINFHATLFGFDVDIHLPSLNVAIDIHGPTHFLPIWSEAKLEKTEREDKEKIATLTKNGIVFFRVIHMAKTISEVDKKVLLDLIIEKLEGIKRKPLKAKDRLIQLEVN